MFPRFELVFTLLGSAMLAWKKMVQGDSKSCFLPLNLWWSLRQPLKIPLPSKHAAMTPASGDLGPLCTVNISTSFQVSSGMVPLWASLLVPVSWGSTLCFPNSVASSLHRSPCCKHSRWTRFLLFGPWLIELLLFFTGTVEEAKSESGDSHPS